MPPFEFHPNATEFDLLNARQLADLSRLAYAAEDEIEPALRQQGDFTQFRFFEFINNQQFIDSQAFIAGRPDVILLVFRGTEPKDIRDWLTDFKYDLKPSKTGRVHHGFAFALNPIWPDIRNAIEQMRTNNQPIWVAGHSLGGALGTIAVDRLTDAGAAVAGLYTFGQPRVGDKVFAEHFEKKLDGKMYRFVNNEDLVTTVPGTWLFFLKQKDYQHVGNLVYFDTFEKMHLNPDLWFIILDRIFSKILRFLAWRRKQKSPWRHDLEDHAKEQYVELIDRQRRPA